MEKKPSHGDEAELGHLALFHLDAKLEIAPTGAAAYGSM